MVSEILPVKNQTICFTLTKWNTIWNIAAKLSLWDINYQPIRIISVFATSVNIKLAVNNSLDDFIFSIAKALLQKQA